MKTILVFQCLLFTNFYLQFSLAENGNPYKHKVTLDPKERYQLEWLVNWDEKRVTFNVTVLTNGYIGFGLSKKGKMSGADIIIGGVGKKGKPYFTDRYAIGNQLPEIDESQDWTLHEAWERGGVTFLSFSRPFDTCDENHDLPITDDVLRLIWAYGEVDDDLQYHFGHRGVYNVYLLDPDLAPRNRGEARRIIPVWNITKDLRVPAKETTYWCSFHKVPTKTKHHIIGFDVIFPTELDRRHIHHLLLYRCYAPIGTQPETIFGGPSKTRGNECYAPVEPDTLGFKYCSETFYVWVAGGRHIFFPEHVGLPISEHGAEYFMLEVHYNNPNLIPNLNLRVSVEAYYTNQLREHDAGMLYIGEWSPGATTLLVPPNSIDYQFLGHCAPGCTQKYFGKTGNIKVFAAVQHTHLSGRGVRVLHFRGKKELPWISYDDNFDFNFQQFRVLRKEREVRPGDQLIMSCNYDTTEKNGSVAIGGFGTRQEMCHSFMYYYNRVPGASNCLSQIRTKEYNQTLGIESVIWDPSRVDMVITNPTQFAGLTMIEYGNNHVEWDIAKREEIQRHHRFQPQVVMCPSSLPEGYPSSIATGDDEHLSEFPRNVKRYSRSPQCRQAYG
ncbi:unnamed protein product [Orchesella dallaii]|uniref:DOMON domain-containing protein n=1 Tax=Orchesella dallaii TaxID=48710 RepID=A0ABP1PV19_9HEXA